MAERKQKMKHIDIDKRFTEIVAEYLAKGYTVNTAAMNGSQGEIAKVDLTNGVEIIRVYVDSFRDYKIHTEGIEIVIGRSTEGIKPHEYTGWDIIWHNALEILSRERFCMIGQTRYYKYYGTEEEAKAAQRKRHDRYMLNNSGRSSQDITDKALEIAKKVISREFGIKRINASKIGVHKYDGKYIIAYNSKVYTLH